MEDLQRDFKGIWIPKEVWLDNRLNALDKIILMEIHSLDNEEKGCYASNQYLAEFCQCTETKVSTTISKLKKLGYIELANFDGRHRSLKIKSLSLKNLKSDIKNFKSNNIVNSINNNIDKSILLDNVENEEKVKDKSDKKLLEEKMLKDNIECIIDYLNDTAGTKYKYNTKGTVTLIKARFKDGFVLDDFYDVIDNKWKDWKGTEWEKYMRPETLFGNKFENYLNTKTFSGKAKTSYSSKPTFDNTATHSNTNPKISDEEINKWDFEKKRNYIMNMAYADMTYSQKKFFNENCLALDENGNLLKF